MSSSSVKGLLKGLRKISQIFETKKEKEIVIGLPTDVKHLAHIGNDCPSSSNTPSWMENFQGRSGTSSAPLANGKPPINQTAKSSKNDMKNQGTRDVQNVSEAPFESPSRGKSRQSRHHKSGSPGREVMAVEKPRTHKQEGTESPGRKKHSSFESPRRSSSSKLGVESPSRDIIASPNPTHESSSPGREVFAVEKPRHHKLAGESPRRKKHSTVESPRRPSSSKPGAESPSRGNIVSPKLSRKSSSPGGEEMDVEKPRHRKQPGTESPRRKKHSNHESPRRRSSSKFGAESPSRGKIASPKRTHKSSSKGGEEIDVEKPRHHKQPGNESPRRKKHSNLESPRRPSSSKVGEESPSPDTNASPKQARRRKKVRSSGEGSTRSRPKSKLHDLQNTAHPHSDPGPGRDKGSDDIIQKSILDKYKDQEL